MKKFKFSFIVVTVVGLLAGVTVMAGGNSGRYYISGPDWGLGMVQTMVGTTHHEFEHGFTGDLSPSQVKAFEVLGGMFGINVEPVELYHVTKGGPPPGKGGGNNGGGDTTREYYPSDQTPWGIVRVNGGSGGAGINVAVLDTGVDKDHLDLTRRVDQCKDFTKHGIKNGCKDGYGHGTHVAGTILADGGADGLGIYGVAPEADLWAYKVCGNSGMCWADDIAAAISHAADQGAEIVSMSLGGNSQSSLIADAINYAVAKGVLVVAAAGNDGPDMGSIDYPGANVKVVAVGATDSADQVPDWSSRGVNDGDHAIEEKEVEFAAPGVNVESTWLDGQYNVISGTSMATPHVAGLAAKVWQGNAADTRSYLQSLAQDIWTKGDDAATGLGLPVVP